MLDASTSVFTLPLLAVFSGAFAGALVAAWVLLRLRARPRGSHALGAGPGRASADGPELSARARAVEIARRFS